MSVIVETMTHCAESGRVEWKRDRSLEDQLDLVHESRIVDKIPP